MGNHTARLAGRSSRVGIAAIAAGADDRPRRLRLIEQHARRRPRPRQSRVPQPLAQRRGRPRHRVRKPTHSSRSPQFLLSETGSYSSSTHDGARTGGRQEALAHLHADRRTHLAASRSEPRRKPRSPSDGAPRSSTTKVIRPRSRQEFAKPSPKRRTRSSCTTSTASMQPRHSARPGKRVSRWRPQSRPIARIWTRMRRACSTTR
jgi:hypothetical protein